MLKSLHDHYVVDLKTYSENYNKLTDTSNNLYSTVLGKKILLHKLH